MIHFLAFKHGLQTSRACYQLLSSSTCFSSLSTSSLRFFFFLWSDRASEEGTMSSGQSLTTTRLIALLESERNAFSNEYLPLSQQQLASLRRFSDLVQLNKSAIHHNVAKKRAQTIMSDFWGHAPEVFILCALVMTFARLGSLKSNDYLRPTLSWWRQVEHPKGLDETVRKCSDHLPPKTMSAQGGYLTMSTNSADTKTERKCRSNESSAPFLVTSLQTDCLLQFLHENPHMRKPLAIRVPFDETESPSIEVSREMCQHLIIRMGNIVSRESKLMVEDKRRGP